MIDFVIYLDAHGVEDSLINSGDIEVKDGEAESLKASHQLQELPGAFLGQYLEVGVAIHHAHFYVRHCPRLILLFCAPTTS